MKKFNEIFYSVFTFTLLLFITSCSAPEEEEEISDEGILELAQLLE